MGECIVDASGIGELLIADVFSRAVVSLVAAIVARYHGSVRLVTSGQNGSRDVSLVSPAARTAKWALVGFFLSHFGRRRARPSLRESRLQGS
jgi:hypothetical protein